MFSTTGVVNHTLAGALAFTDPFFAPANFYKFIGDHQWKSLVSVGFGKKERICIFKYYE